MKILFDMKKKLMFFVFIITIFFTSPIFAEEYNNIIFNCLDEVNSKKMQLNYEKGKQNRTGSHVVDKIYLDERDNFIYVRMTNGDFVKFDQVSGSIWSLTGNKSAFKCQHNVVSVSTNTTIKSEEDLNPKIEYILSELNNLKKQINNLENLIQTKKNNTTKESDVTERCSIRVVEQEWGKEIIFVVGLTNDEVIMATGSEDGLKTVPVSIVANVDGKEKKFTGNLGGIQVFGGNFQSPFGAPLLQVNDESLLKAKNIDINNCKIYFN